MTKIALRIAVTVVLVTLASALAPGQTSPSLDHDAQRLRHFYLNHDADLVILEGEALAIRKGATTETRAWFLTQALQNYRDLGHALPLYTYLSELRNSSAPEDPWTLVVRATAANTFDDKMMLCERAVANSSRPEILMLCIDSFGNRVAKTEVPAYRAFLDKYRSRLEATADGLVSEVAALRALQASGEKIDREELRSLNARALVLDPHNVRATLDKVRDLRRDRKYTEADSTLRDALTWAADSASVHQSYLLGLPDLKLSDDEAARRAELSGTLMLEKTRPGPIPIYYLLQALLKDEARGRAMAELVLKIQPGSQGADMARVYLARSKVADLRGDIPTKNRDEVVRNLLAFLTGPGTRSWYAENSAAGILRALLVDTPGGPTDPDLLFEAARVVRSDLASRFAIAALDEKFDPSAVAQLATDKLDAATRTAREHSKEWFLASAMSSDNTTHWNSVSDWNDVLGYAYLRQARVDEAGKRLMLAESLKNAARPSLDIQLHLARYYIAKRDYTQAAKRLDRALAATNTGQGEHPAIQAFRDLYIAQHGSAKGIELYIAAVFERDRVNRKPRVLATRIQSPEPIPAFSLKTLDGKPMSSAELKGKIYVINFWGSWCPPCRKEMPELQKFYEKYKGDPNVAILTIDDDPDTETAKPFLKQKGYTFPVLWAADYLPTAHVNTFPTTWFVNAEGRKVFEKMGATNDLEAEFSWRVEAIRERNKSKETTPANETIDPGDVF
jgi:thiol-disulfide isomerase/thioredoxin